MGAVGGAFLGGFAEWRSGGSGSRIALGALAGFGTGFLGFGMVTAVGRWATPVVGGMASTVMLK
jgi:hypothetical protein